MNPIQKDSVTQPTTPTTPTVGSPTLSNPTDSVHFNDSTNNICPLTTNNPDAFYLSSTAGLVPAHLAMEFPTFDELDKTFNKSSNNHAVETSSTTKNVPLTENNTVQCFSSPQAKPSGVQFSTKRLVKAVTLSRSRTWHKSDQPSPIDPNDSQSAARKLFPKSFSRARSRSRSRNPRATSPSPIQFNEIGSSLRVSPLLTARSNNSFESNESLELDLKNFKKNVIKKMQFSTGTFPETNLHYQIDHGNWIA